MEPIFALEKRNQGIIRMSFGDGQVLGESLFSKDIIEAEEVEVKTIIDGIAYYIIINNISQVSDKRYNGIICDFRPSTVENIPLKFFDFIDQEIEFSEDDIHYAFYTR